MRLTIGDIYSTSVFVNNSTYRRYFDYPNSITQGGITASMAGGSMLSSLFGGPICDRYGRKKLIQGAAVIWIIAAAIQCSSQNKAQLICGRIISGVAVGLTSSQVPVYVSELAPKSIRGRLVGVFQWAVTWGIMVFFYISYGCTYIPGNASFRTAWGLQMVPGLFLLIGTFFLPESPRWLATHDRWEEAIDTLANIHAKGNKYDQKVITEIKEMKEMILIEREANKLKFIDLLGKQSIKRTLVGIWCHIWQQLSGINIMMYYIIYLFNMAGYTGNINLVTSSINYVINVIMTIPALLFIDKVGRRKIFMSGSLLMMVWLFSTAAIFAVFGEAVDNVEGNQEIRMMINHKQASRAVIACSYLYIASFAPTWGPAAWIYVSEIFPTRQRAKATGLSTCANWAFNFALALFVPTSFKNITWKTFIIFGVFCFIMTIHVFLLFPETGGKTLEEIEQMWLDDPPAWRSANYLQNRKELLVPKGKVNHSYDNSISDMS